MNVNGHAFRGNNCQFCSMGFNYKRKAIYFSGGGGGGGGREVFSSKIPLLESFQLPEKLTGSNKSCLPLKKNGGWVVVGGNTWWCTIYLKRFGIWHILELFEAQKPTTDFVSSFYLGLYLQTGLSLIIHYLLGYLQAYL